MVAGIVIVIGALIVTLVIFKDDIANFLSGGLTGAVEGAEESLEAIGGSVFDAGAGLGKQFAMAEDIRRAEAELEKQAKDSGFESIEAFNKATDSGSVVIGGQKTVVDFGLIGDVIPTNPSREFILSEEGQALIQSNAEFKKIVEAQAAQEGTEPSAFGFSFPSLTTLFGQTGTTPESGGDSNVFARFGGTRFRR